MENIVKKLEEQVTFLQQEISQLSNELYSQQKDIRYLKKENKYSIKVIRKKRSVFKYYSPFYGVYYCWKFFLKKQKVGYINYLPILKII